MVIYNLNIFYLISFVREFLFLLQKIILIALISFGNFGSGEIKVQNNAFLCFIVCSISVVAQIHDKPFLTKELNSLNLKANIVMMITIFMGLFSSVCGDPFIQTVLMIAVVLFNGFFLLIFFQNYLVINFATAKNSRYLELIYKYIRICFEKGKKLINFYCFEVINVDIDNMKQTIIMVENNWDLKNLELTKGNMEITSKFELLGNKDIRNADGNEKIPNLNSLERFPLMEVEGSHGEEMKKKLDYLTDKKKNLTEKKVSFESLQIKAQQMEIKKLRKIITNLEKENILPVSQNEVPEEKIQTGKKWNFKDEKFKLDLEEMKIQIQKINSDDITELRKNGIQAMKLKINNMNDQSIVINKCEIQAENSHYFEFFSK